MVGQMIWRQRRKTEIFFSPISYGTESKPNCRSKCNEDACNTNNIGVEEFAGSSWKTDILLLSNDYAEFVAQVDIR